MALVTPMDLLKSLKRKVCMHSSVYFRTNRQTGATYSAKLCNPSEKEPSAKQLKAQARFKKVAAAVRAILADPAQKAVLEAEYKAQAKVGSLFGYAYRKLNADYDENGDVISG